MLYEYLITNMKTGYGPFPSTVISYLRQIAHGGADGMPASKVVHSPESTRSTY
jgi:hypothetical protein